MPSKLMLAGERFGKLVVVAESGRDKHGAVMWLCTCACGATAAVRGSGLKAGTTRSCGCGVAEAASMPRSHGQTGSPLYQRWRAMLGRTGNPKHHEYANYGGRGIGVCARWRQSFEAFQADMGPGFSPDLELDRRDVDGDYEPGNCRWVTSTEQQRNKRNNHRVTFDGRTQTVQGWAEELGIKPNTIVTRLRRGWPVDRALAPVAIRALGGMSE